MRKPKITAKQEGGDDGYCYVVRIDGKVFVDGLTRAELPYYKREAKLRYWIHEKLRSDIGSQRRQDAVKVLLSMGHEPTLEEVSR